MSQQNNDLEIRTNIENWFKSERVLLLTKNEQPKGRQQVCIELHDNCAAECLKALCVSSKEALFRKMRAAHSKDNKTGFAFTENYGHKCEREGLVYKTLQGHFDFEKMPQSQSCANKIWSYANDEKADIVQLWTRTLQRVNGDATQAKKCHVIDAFTHGNLQDKVTDLQTQLQTQNQQVEEQLAVRVAARVAEEKKKLEDDYKKQLDIEIRNTEDNLRGRILDLSDNCTEIEEKKKEAEAKLADKNKEIEEKKKEAEAMLADKNKEIEQLNKSLEEEKARSAIAISASEIFNTPTQDRRDSTTSTSSDITLVDSDITPSSGCGTKRSFHDLEEENENMKQRIKIHKKCFREIDNAVHLAYCIEVGPDSEETLITSIETLCAYFKENKDLVDKKQPPKYEIKIHPNGKVMKDLAHWKSNTWSHLVWMVGEIEKSMEKRDL